MTDQTIESPGEELALDESYTPARVLGGMPYFDQYLLLADRICRTAMVPSDSRGKPDQVLAIIMYGAELGIGPMQALQQINFIEGKPATSPELMRALIRKAGHKLNIKSTRTECVIDAERGDTGEMGSSDFTLDDAVIAGLCTVDQDGRVRARSSQGKALPWEKYTKDLLLARATSRIARMMFSDVVAGMSYTPEEVMSFSSPEAAPVPVVEPASQDQKDDIRARLELLHPDERKAFAQWWEDSGITRGVQNLSISEAEQVRARLKEIAHDESDIVEAEIVGDETDETLNSQDETETSLSDTPGIIDADQISAPRATKNKLAQLAIKFDEAGFGDRDIIMEYCSKVAKRPITTRTDLTTAEANLILQQLASESGQ